MHGANDKEPDLLFGIDDFYDEPATKERSQIRWLLDIEGMF